MKALKGFLAVLIFASTPALADDAQSLWSSKCKSCHAENGSADTKIGREKKVEDMGTAAWQAKKSDGDIKKVIRDGVADTKMKAYGDKLSDAELASLVAHIRGFKK